MILLVCAWFVICGGLYVFTLASEHVIYGIVSGDKATVCPNIEGKTKIHSIKEGIIYNIIGLICCCCISKLILFICYCFFFNSSMIALSFFFIASVYLFLHSPVSFITVFIFSIFVVFLLNKAIAIFKPIAIRAATMAEITILEKSG